LLWLLGCAGCASYLGSARDFSPSTLDSEAGWIAVRSVPWFEQRGKHDCGAAAIAMVVSHWTGAAAEHVAAALRPASNSGIQAQRLRTVAQAHGLAAFLVHGRLDDLAHELDQGRPVLVGLAKPHRDGLLPHYEVVVAFHRQKQLVVTLDPAAGWRQNTVDGFVAEWKPAGFLALVVMKAAPPAEAPSKSASRSPRHDGLWQPHRLTW
jgi:ABC-type bacteriocin/lantibiotic exporter with double-glycine peptidase domain